MQVPHVENTIILVVYCLRYAIKLHGWNVNILHRKTTKDAFGNEFERNVYTKAG